MMATNMGTHLTEASILFSLKIMVFLMAKRKAAAMMPPSTGEMIQEAAIFPMVPQATIPKPAAAIPAPMTPPTMEWVVDTGAFDRVAKLSQSAAASSAAIIAQMKESVLPPNAEMSMIPFLMVLTTSPPAISAPEASKMAAMTMAPPIVSALEPTAGPTLLATSFAPMFMAM